VEDLADARAEGAAGRRGAARAARATWVAGGAEEAGVATTIKPKTTYTRVARVDCDTSVWAANPQLLVENKKLERFIPRKLGMECAPRLQHGSSVKVQVAVRAERVVRAMEALQRSGITSGGAVEAAAGAGRTNMGRRGGHVSGNAAVDMFRREKCDGVAAVGAEEAGASAAAGRNGAPAASPAFRDGPLGSCVVLEVTGSWLCEKPRKDPTGAEPRTLSSSKYACIRSKALRPFEGWLLTHIGYRDFEPREEVSSCLPTTMTA
jgi:hypothetical protein